jgi:diguanylate cyclase (GGDEF)-like protein/PAS domain S-box-containing protein
MRTALEAMEQNAELRIALRNKDRDALLAQAHGLFRKLKSKHLITHFYFSGPGRKNILRVHAPAHHGDTIDRRTTLNAQETGRFSYGLELGYDGLLTLRTVAPWREGVDLIGYVELGAGIDHIVNRLEKDFGSQLVIAINKKYLEREQWESGQRLFNINNSWEQFPDWVLSRFDALSIPHSEWPGLDKIINASAGDGPESEVNGRKHRWSSVPLEDAGGRTIGYTLILLDLSAAKHRGWSNLLWVFIGSLVVGSFVLVILYLVSQKTETQLDESQQQLLRARDELEQRVNLKTRELSDSERKYRELVENANSIILRWDTTGHVTFFNEYAQKVFGYSEDEILGHHVIGTIVPETEDDTGRNLKEMIKEICRHPERYPKNENENIRKDGSRIWVVWTNKAITDEQGNATEILSVGQDLTERKTYEARIHLMAYYDDLTGLPNRTLFLDRLKLALLHVRRNKQQLGLIYMDLDQFKAVNDSLGHATGDRLLKLVSQRLRDCVREEDTVARMGGDEFTVTIGNLKAAEALDVVTRIADKLKRRMEESFEIGGNEMYVTASMGIVLYPRDGTTVDELTKNADTAMYCSKANGRNTYQMFKTDMKIEAMKRHQLEVKLRHALERQELFLRYQPLVDLKTEALLGVEALLGWNSDELGYVPPAEFIHIAEQTGLIDKIGDWVQETACRQFMEWRKMGYEIPGLTINLSPHQIRQANYVSHMKAILQRTGMEPQMLTMEVTENVLIVDQERAVSVMHKLKSLGVGIAMDDFGTGYSSLSHLKQLPVDIVKIDRSFIIDIPGDKDDAEIVTAIIAMSQRLNLTVVAEGIETTAQKDFLQRLDCNAGQGLLFSKALVSSDLQAWMNSRKKGLDESQPLLRNPAA